MRDKRKSTTALALGFITIILSLIVMITNSIAESITGQEPSYVLVFALLISGMIVALTGWFCGGAENANCTKDESEEGQ